jgi:hypothetical protein
MQRRRFERRSWTSRAARLRPDARARYSRAPHLTGILLTTSLR